MTRKKVKVAFFSFFPVRRLNFPDFPDFLLKFLPNVKISFWKEISFQVGNDAWTAWTGNSRCVTCVSCCVIKADCNSFFE